MIELPPPHPQVPVTVLLNAIPSPPRKNIGTIHYNSRHYKKVSLYIFPSSCTFVVLAGMHEHYLSIYYRIKAG
jgi:hypothetical protein